MRKKEYDRIQEIRRQVQNMDIPDLDKALKIRFDPIPNGKTSQVANNKSGEMILWKKSALKAYNVGLSVIPDRDAKKDDLSGENDYLTEIEIKIKKKELLDNWDSEIEKGTFGEEKWKGIIKLFLGY